MGQEGETERLGQRQKAAEREGVYRERGTGKEAGVSVRSRGVGYVRGGKGRWTSSWSEVGPLTLQPLKNLHFSNRLKLFPAGGRGREQIDVFL